MTAGKVLQNTKMWCKYLLPGNVSLLLDWHLTRLSLAFAPLRQHQVPQAQAVNQLFIVQ